MLRRFVEGDRCRWQFLLGYFGEPTTDACGRCDVCGRSTSAMRPAHDVAATVDATARHGFAPGDAVRHESFGDGSVVEVSGDELVVMFDQAGYRVLSRAVVTANGLLRPSPSSERPVDT